MNGEPERQFIDTNILVYAHDSAAGQKHTEARDLLETLWESRGGCLNIQVLQEFYVTVTQKVVMPYEPREAVKIIEDLSTWHVHSPGVTDIVVAIDLQTRYQLSFWDAMILQSALRLGCKLIWTEDLNHGQTIHNLTIRNPFK